jgi:hypothetical protein
LVGSGYTNGPSRCINIKLNSVVDINGSSSIVDMLLQRDIPQSDQNVIATVITALGLY